MNAPTSTAASRRLGKKRKRCCLERTEKVLKRFSMEQSSAVVTERCRVVNVSMANEARGGDLVINFVI